MRHLLLLMKAESHMLSDSKSWCFMRNTKYHKTVSVGNPATRQWAPRILQGHQDGGTLPTVSLCDARAQGDGLDAKNIPHGVLWLRGWAEQSPARASTNPGYRALGALQESHQVRQDGIRVWLP